MSNATSSTEERALALLGSGAGPEQVAAALGVEVSRISQLLSDEVFSQKVAELRFASLAKHTARDTKYDEIEDTLQERLSQAIPMMFKPSDILRATQVVNSLKRRGASAPEMIHGTNAVVTLVMPIKLVQKFQTNIQNQVIQAGSQELVTIQSSTLLDQIKKKETHDGSVRISNKEGYPRLPASAANGS